MKNDFLPKRESELLFPTALSCLGDFLINFCENSQFSTLIKDAVTEQHMLANQVCADKWSMSPQAMMGTTIEEIYDRVTTFYNKSQLIEKVKVAEQEALKNNRQTNLTYVLMKYNGLVNSQCTSYIPVFGLSKQPITLCCITQDLTRYTNLLRLFEVYRSYYPKKSEALQYFSQYLEVDHYFAEKVNSGELSVLCALTIDIRAKSVAKLLSVSCKTVACYMASLRDKLKSNIDLDMLLNNLRARQQWDFNQAVI